MELPSKRIKTENRAHAAAAAAAAVTDVDTARISIATYRHTTATAAAKSDAPSVVIQSAGTFFEGEDITAVTVSSSTQFQSPPPSIFTGGYFKVNRQSQKVTGRSCTPSRRRKMAGTAKAAAPVGKINAEEETWKRAGMARMTDLAPHRKKVMRPDPANASSAGADNGQSSAVAAADDDDDELMWHAWTALINDVSADLSKFGVLPEAKPCGTVVVAEPLVFERRSANANVRHSEPVDELELLPSRHAVRLVVPQSIAMPVLQWNRLDAYTRLIVPSSGDQPWQPRSPDSRRASSVPKGWRQSQQQLPDESIVGSAFDDVSADSIFMDHTPTTPPSHDAAAWSQPAEETGPQLEVIDCEVKAVVTWPPTAKKPVPLTPPPAASRPARKASTDIKARIPRKLFSPVLEAELSETKCVAAAAAAASEQPTERPAASPTTTAAATLLQLCLPEQPPAATTMRQDGTPDFWFHATSTGVETPYSVRVCNHAAAPP